MSVDNIIILSKMRSENEQTSRLIFARRSAKVRGCQDKSFSPGSPTDKNPTETDLENVPAIECHLGPRLISREMVLLLNCRRTRSVRTCPTLVKPNPQKRNSVAM